MGREEELTPFENAIEGVSQIAQLMHAYYLALIESGFSTDEAMLLTIQYQTCLLGVAGSKKSGKED